VSAYCSAVRELGFRLYVAISEGLGLDGAYIKEALGEQEQHMAVNFYPRCPAPELTYGLPAHTDPNALTILLMDQQVAGLQVLKDGRWIAVNPRPGALVVNIGDQLQVTCSCLALPLFPVKREPSHLLSAAARWPPLHCTCTGAEQRQVQERVAPRRRQRRQAEDVGGVVPLPLQRRAHRPRRQAPHRRHARRLQGLHLRRVLRQVLEQEPGPGALPRALQDPDLLGVFWMLLFHFSFSVLVCLLLEWNLPTASETVCTVPLISSPSK
jgi:hypothetical protein